MAWTTPKTWAALEKVTETMLNTHVRDNLNWLKAAILGQAPISFSNADATPSVSAGNNFKVPYTTTTIITNLDDGVDGQIVVLYICPTGGATVTVNRDHAKLAGGANFAVTSGNYGTLVLQLQGTVWVELSRATVS